MKSLLPCRVFFVALLALARADGGIQWGNPVNGLRLGVSGPAGDITAGQIRSLPSPRKTSQRIEMKADPDPLVRCYLACALGQSGDKRAIPVLAQFLDDPDLETRIWAAGELGHCQNKEAYPVLIDLLRHRQLTDQQGNIIEDLQQLTAKNLGYDPKRWLDWWKTSGAAE